MMHAHVVVIGGGAAGVAAAAALRARGCAVTLLEARATLGGRVRSDVLDGITIDAGAQLITAAYRRTLGLLASASRPAWHTVLVSDSFVRAGARHPVRFGSLRSLLTFDGLAAADRVRFAARVVPLLARYHDALDADASRLPATLDAESAREVIETRVGSDGADTLVEPPCGAFYGLRGREVSGAFLLALGRYASEGDVLAPLAGWSQTLMDALPDVAITCDARVTAITPAPNGWTGGTVIDGDDGRRWSADAVVVATGPRGAAALLDGTGSAKLIEWLRAVPIRATFTLALVTDRAMRRDAFGHFRDVHDRRYVSAAAVHGAKLGAFAPPDRDVVLAWPTPLGADVLAERRADDIALAMLPEIEGVLPDLRGHVTRARVYRFDEGTPIPFPGFVRDRERARRLADLLPAHIAIAGDYLATPLIEGAVAMGERAAARLLTTLGTDGS